MSEIKATLSDRKSIYLAILQFIKWDVVRNKLAEIETDTKTNLKTNRPDFTTVRAICSGETARTIMMRTLTGMFYPVPKYRVLTQEDEEIRSKSENKKAEYMYMYIFKRLPLGSAVFDSWSLFNWNPVLTVDFVEKYKITLSQLIKEGVSFTDIFKCGLGQSFDDLKKNLSFNLQDLIINKQNFGISHLKTFYYKAPTSFCKQFGCTQFDLLITLLLNVMEITTIELNAEDLLVKFHENHQPTFVLQNSYAMHAPIHKIIFYRWFLTTNKAHYLLDSSQEWLNEILRILTSNSTGDSIFDWAFYLSLNDETLCKVFDSDENELTKIVSMQSPRLSLTKYSSVKRLSLTQFSSFKQFYEKVDSNKQKRQTTNKKSVTSTTEHDSITEQIKKEKKLQSKPKINKEIFVYKKDEKTNHNIFLVVALVVHTGNTIFREKKHVFTEIKNAFIDSEQKSTESYFHYLLERLSHTGLRERIKDVHKAKCKLQVVTDEVLDFETTFSDKAFIPKIIEDSSKGIDMKHEEIDKKQQSEMESNFLRYSRQIGLNLSSEEASMSTDCKVHFSFGYPVYIEEAMKSISTILSAIPSNTGQPIYSVLVVGALPCRLIIFLEKIRDTSKTHSHLHKNSKTKATKSGTDKKDKDRNKKSVIRRRNRQQINIRNNEPVPDT